MIVLCPGKEENLLPPAGRGLETGLTFQAEFLFSLHILNTRCGGAYNQILCGMNPAFWITGICHTSHLYILLILGDEALQNVKAGFIPQRI